MVVCSGTMYHFGRNHNTTGDWKTAGKSGTGKDGMKQKSVKESKEEGPIDLASRARVWWSCDLLWFGWGGGWVRVSCTHTTISQSTTGGEAAAAVALATWRVQPVTNCAWCVWGVVVADCVCGYVFISV
jgi:hypothetical protein